MKRLALAILMLVGTVHAQNYMTLDSDFFGDGSAPQGNYPATLEMNPDFFRSQRGSLSEALPGQFGCTTVAAASPQSESNAVGRVAQAYCKGSPSVKWVPYSTYSSNGLAQSQAKVKGYYQICCVKKEGQRGRRPGPR